MNSEYQNERDKDKLLENMQDKIVNEFREQFPDIDFTQRESVGNSIL